MNRHDWLKIIGGLGLGATGLGLAGIGPLAALGAGAKGATLAAGLAGPTTQGAGGLLGIGASIGKAAPAVSAGLQGAQMAGGLLGGAQPQQAPQAPPMQPQQAMGPSFGGYRGSESLPPELAGLPPDHPKVRAYMMQRGMA